MTSTQAQNIAATLIGFNCNVETRFDPRLNEWIVSATKPNATVNSTTMTAIALGVSPSTPVIVARTDRAEFI